MKLKKYKNNNEFSFDANAINFAQTQTTIQKWKKNDRLQAVLISFGF